MKKKILIKGGRLFDPANKLDKRGDLLIEEGKIKKIGENLAAKNAEIVNAKGTIIAPGFIDLHTHLRDPGRTDEETIESGCAAAAHGGFTTILSMPNTDPVADRASVIEYVLEKASIANQVYILPVGSNSKRGEGKELAEMAEMIEVKARAFSNDGLESGNSQMLRRSVQYCKMLNVPLLWHCEDISLSAEGQMNESKWSTKLGLRGAPTIAEENALSELVAIAQYEDARVHAQHVTTSGSVEIIRRAKAGGVSITAEVCPHHLLFTEEDLAASGYDTNLKMNPPLRSRADVEALIEGLKDGTIDAIATDHAPHARHEKEQEFENAPFGITGLETCFSALWTNLGEELGLVLIIEKLTAGPARVIGENDRGALKPRFVGDVAIIDLNAGFECTPDWFHSKSLNTPFLDEKLKGAVKHTIAAGEIVMKDFKLVG